MSQELRTLTRLACRSGERNRVENENGHSRAKLQRLYASSSSVQADGEGRALDSVGLYAWVCRGSENSPADCQISPPSPGPASNSPRLLALQLNMLAVWNFLFLFLGVLIPTSEP